VSIEQTHLPNGPLSRFFLQLHGGRKKLKESPMTQFDADNDSRSMLMNLRAGCDPDELLTSLFNRVSTNNDIQEAQKYALARFEEAYLQLGLPFDKSHYSTFLAEYVMLWHSS